MQKDDGKKEINLVCETGIGFSQRDANVKHQEDKGLLTFKVIKNDGDFQNLKLLTDLKNIIAKQLPKMPKEYIVRLVFDRKHESMVIIKICEGAKEKVLGGICYRPNKEQGFIEIAFLAISSLEQVKGFGTRLMNKLKDHCRDNGIEYCLTYADNNAIGYFKKQGFSQYLKMPIEKWKGYIKDYDGGTLMEAYCNPIIEYSTLSEILKEQKNCIKSIAMKFLNVKRKYTYAELEKSLKNNKIDPNELNRVTNTNISEELFNAIPGMKCSGWTYQDYKKNAEAEKNGSKSFIDCCRQLISEMEGIKNAWPFLEPVDPKQVTDYYQIIKEPMDFRTLRKNVESGNYKNKQDFEKDLRKIFNNCRQYNGKNTVYYKSANTLEAKANELLKDMPNE